jgi:hypothetical protein
VLYREKKVVALILRKIIHKHMYFQNPQYCALSLIFRATDDVKGLILSLIKHIDNFTYQKRILNSVIKQLQFELQSRVEQSQEVLDYFE